MLKPNKYLDSFIEKNKDKLFIECNKHICEKEFLKVYIASIDVLSELTKSTKIVYEYLFRRLQASSSYNITKLLFTFKDYTIYCNDNDIKAVPEASFYRARNELIKNDIIDNSGSDGYFYFNLNYFFNGDRIQVAINYIKVNNIEIKNDKPKLKIVSNNDYTEGYKHKDNKEFIKEKETEGYKQSKKSAFQS